MFSSRAEGLAWARNIEAQQDRGAWIDPTESLRTTLSEALRRYVAEISPSKKGYKQEKYISTVLLRHPIAAYVLGNIRSAHVAAYRDERLRTVKPATVLRELALLSHVFTVAIKEWRMENLRNPVQMIRKPRLPRGRDRRPGMVQVGDGEVSELDLISAATDSPVLPAVLTMLVETAMRREELATLRWEQVNLRERYLCLDDTKNGSRRLVPLTVKAMALLEKMPRNPKDPRVFGISKHGITRAYLRARKRAGIKDLRLHDLRHEATSRLFEVYDLNTLEAAAITGHRDLRMLARYTHISPQALIRKLDRAGGVMAETTSRTS